MLSDAEEKDELALVLKLDDDRESIPGDSSAASSIAGRLTGIPKPRITVEYERVGSFDVFETTCPLEYSPFPPPPPPTAHQAARSRRKPPRGSNRKVLQTISIVDNISSESEDELTAAYNQKIRELQDPPPVMMSVYLDTFFRSENPTSKEPVDGQAAVFWAKGDSAKIPSCPKEGEDSESDLDPEIAKYIETQQDKKYNGENVTGERLWYDQERSLIRNLHTNGSISLTSYGDTDERIFGNTEIFDQILTPEERAMLCARPAEEPNLKPDKKKKSHHHLLPADPKKLKKNSSSSRPKDQGDWL